MIVISPSLKVSKLKRKNINSAKRRDFCQQKPTASSSSLSLSRSRSELHSTAMHHAYITPSQTHHHGHRDHRPAAPKSPSALAPPPAAAAASSSAFTVICVLHALIALFCGSLMMFHARAIYSLGHGTDAAERLLGSTPQDRLLIRTSDSFAGLLLLAIGLLLLMVSNIKDRDFQDFFAKGCTVLHVFVAVWRVSFERRVEDLAGDCLRQTVGDFLLALSWVLFVVYSWREKYD